MPARPPCAESHPRTSPEGTSPEETGYRSVTGREHWSMPGTNPALRVGMLGLAAALAVIACTPGTVVVGTDPGAHPRSPTSPADPSPVDSDHAAVASRIIQHTNDARIGLGLAPLAMNARLMHAAQLHAEQMSQAGRMEHTLPSARYPALTDRLAAAGYEWSATAENIALDYREAAGAVDGWMRSPSHRANMLSATYSEMGAGYMVDARGHRYYVQVFGRPRQR